MTRSLLSGLLAVLLIAPVAAPSAASALEPAQVETGFSAGAVRVLTSGPADTRHWSSVPVRFTLVAEQPGTLWYRWGPGPGGWSRVDGPLVAPEGKQQLSILHVAEDGIPEDPSVITVRSDFSAPVAHLRAASDQMQEATHVAGASGATVQVLASVRGIAGTTVRRVQGRDRYAVAAEVSSSNFATAGTVIVASGENFPDALTAAGLAGCLNAPMMLTQRRTLPTSIRDEIKRLSPSKAIVCGGPATVDPAVVTQLQQMGLTVERIGGANRYEVAANTAARIRSFTGTGGRVLIARGDIYPDALSLGPIAYKRKEPILLVQPNRLPDATSAALRSGYRSAAVAGGPVSVSPEVFTRINGIVGSTERWGGGNRYEAAANIAAESIRTGDLTWSDVSIAKGTDFPDALTGGIAAGSKGGVLLLTQPDALSAPTRNSLTAHTGSIRRVDVLGGPVSITPRTYEQIAAIFR